MTDQLDVREFVQSLRDGAPATLPEERVAKLIVDHLADSGDLSVRALKECARDLRILAETSDRSNYAGDRSREVSRPVPQERTKPAANVVSTLLVDSLQPDVEKLRLELFESSEPPFPNFEDAALWMEGEGAQRTAPESRHLERGHEIIDEIGRRAAELSELWDMPIYSPAIDRLSISYVNPEGGPARADVGPVKVSVAMGLRSKLVPIKRFIISASSRTGFSEESLVAYILSGTPPLLPELTVTTSYFRNLDVPPVDKIEIRTENFRKEDVTRAFKALQRARGGRKAAPVDAQDHLIIEVVRQLGGIPERGKGEFWSRVSRELRRNGMKLSADAARMRWYRLRKKGIAPALLASLERSS